MTSIKCRYRERICGHPERKTEVVYTDEWWFCDSNDGCEIGGYEPNARERVTNPTCRYSQFIDREFEKQVKEYNYTKGDALIIPMGKGKGNEIIHSGRMEYLEIDGRVLIKDWEEGEE